MEKTSAAHFRCSDAPVNDAVTEGLSLNRGAFTLAVSRQDLVTTVVASLDAEAGMSSGTSVSRNFTPVDKCLAGAQHMTREDNTVRALTVLNVTEAPHIAYHNIGANTKGIITVTVYV